MYPSSTRSFRISFGVFCLAFLTMSVGNINAQEAPVPVPRHGLEINLVWPFIPGLSKIAVQDSFQLWRDGGLAGNLIYGVLIRPLVHDPNQGNIMELGGNIGYRQYFWDGLHLEVDAYPLYARLEKNLVDGLDYDAFKISLKLYAGYTLDIIRTPDFRLFADIQVGIGYYLQTTTWPTVKPDSNPFLVPTILLGAGF